VFARTFDISGGEYQSGAEFERDEQNYLTNLAVFAILKIQKGVAGKRLAQEVNENNRSSARTWRLFSAVFANHVYQCRNCDNQRQQLIQRQIASPPLPVTFGGFLANRLPLWQRWTSFYYCFPRFVNLQIKCERDLSGNNTRSILAYSSNVICGCERT
jgi:hypothetical protein